MMWIKYLITLKFIDSALIASCFCYIFISYHIFITSDYLKKSSICFFINKKNCMTYMLKNSYYKNTNNTITPKRHNNDFQTSSKSVMISRKLNAKKASQINK